MYCTKIIWMTLAWLVMASATYAQQTGVGAATPDVMEPAAMEEVIVSGERAGPQLWRISKGDHVLWLLGAPYALPRNVTWRSHDVEAVLTTSQWVLNDARVDASPGFFNLLPLYFQYRRVIRLPDNETLRDWISEDSWQRYQALAARYLPNKNYDQHRPLYVAVKLWEEAMKQSGVNQRGVVQKQVHKLAKQAGLTIQDVTIAVPKPAQAARQLLNELAQIPRDKEIACFDAMVRTLDDSIATLQQRATAWAMGDVRALRALQNADRQACAEAFLSSEQVQKVGEQMRLQWYAAARQALNEHASTFALRAMDDVLGDEGVLKRFRADGYEVQGP